MKISFSPIRSDEQYEATVSGDVLTINSDPMDFGPLPDGATLPQTDVPCPWLASDVERVGGEICLTLLLPHGANAPQETRFPEPITVTDGPVPFPIYDAEPEEEAVV